MAFDRPQQNGTGYRSMLPQPKFRDVTPQGGRVDEPARAPTRVPAARPTADGPMQSAEADVVRAPQELIDRIPELLSPRSGYAAYAGIGSRETPIAVAEEMALIAAELEKRNFKMRSGGADGKKGQKPGTASADVSFERGVADASNKEIFIPWAGFAGSKDGIVLPRALEQKALQIASEAHPAWDRCSDGAKKLHTRNVPQVLGKDLRTPIEFGMGWTFDGGATGGTGQAIRICQNEGIPFLNLRDDRVRGAVLAELGIERVRDRAVEVARAAAQERVQSPPDQPMIRRSQPGVSYASGDVSADGAQVVVNTVNSRLSPSGRGVMGAGVAKAFAERFPSILRDYEAAIRSGKLRPGTAMLFDLPDGRKWAALATKDEWRDPSRMEWVDRGLKDLAVNMAKAGLTSVALPPPGCGNGGLDWREVEPLVHKHLSGFDVTIYAKPSGAVKSEPGVLREAKEVTLARIVGRSSDPAEEKGARPFDFSVSQRPAQPWDRAGSATFCKVRERNGLYSNMHNDYPYEDGGLLWKSTEAQYQAGRYPHLPEVQEAIRAAPNAYVAKQVSREHYAHTRPDWDEVKVPMMAYVVTRKRDAHPDFAAAVEAASRSGTPIVEISMGDDYWGAKPQGNRLVGQNVLGGILDQSGAGARMDQLPKGTSFPTPAQAAEIARGGRIAEPQRADRREAPQSARPSMDATMYFSYGRDRRPGVQSSSTFEAILAGERTSTTRFDSWQGSERWGAVKPGTVVRMFEDKDKSGRFVDVRVTGVERIDLSSCSDERLEQWSKAEGWSAEHGRASGRKNGAGWQVRYEPVPGQEILRERGSEKEDDALAALSAAHQRRRAFGR